MTLDIQSIDHMIVLPDSKQKSNLDEIGQLLIQGSVCIYIENDQMSLLHSVPLQEHRSIERVKQNHSFSVHKLLLRIPLEPI